MESSLITAIGSFAGDIVIKNLKKLGHRVIGCDIYPKEWIADAYQVNQFFQAPYAIDEMEYLEFIKKVCLCEEISYIIPLTDVEVDVFNHNRHWFEQNNVCLCMSPKETIDICRNKKSIEEFITGRFGIQTIPTMLLSEVDSSPFQFPIVCKPIDGRSSQGLKFIKNFNEWVAFTKDIDKKRHIVQPYIEGSIITVDVVRQKDGKKAVAIARKELLRTLNGAGISVYVFKDEMLETLSKELANSLNIVGCINFEFIQDKSGIYHFLECNPRFSGGVEFSCIAGFNCVRNHISCFKGEEIDNFTMLHNQFIARKYEEFITCEE